eukprot:2227325-Amphidinium_carterae.1
MVANSGPPAKNRSKASDANRNRSPSPPPRSSSQGSGEKKTPEETPRKPAPPDAFGQKCGKRSF